ncbi:MAG: LL-diaminopimelate aminotransferase [Candidatus Omnitrophica bacterium]|nr:LL-diaminopimelate aminotransferase [Candidatus Omnitrophota bacterium]
MEIRKAERLSALPPYLFVEIDKAKQRLKQEGHDVIDLGVGDPDLPTPEPIIRALQQTAEDPANHRYSFTEGLGALRAAIAGWYRRRFGVELDPATEVLPLLGSKEGIAHLPLALVDPGEAVLVPDPCYPPYRSGTIFAGAEPLPLPLEAERGWWPDFGGVSQRAARRAKLMFLNYPNNPTAALATAEAFAEAIALARDYRIVIAHDAAYSEIAFDGVRPLSLLQMPGAKELAVEFHSLSKTYNMTGWRVGWACGNAAVIGALAQLKTNLDSGIFQPVQYAAIEALTGDQSSLRSAVETYQRRRDLLVDGLRAAGWDIPKPQASFYVWAAAPKGQTSMAFAKRLLDEAHVILTPGSGFGAQGDGYIRMSLTVPTERIEEAVERISKAL